MSSKTAKTSKKSVEVEGKQKSLITTRLLLEMIAEHFFLHSHEIKHHWFPLRETIQYGLLKKKTKIFVSNHFLRSSFWEASNCITITVRSLNLDVRLEKRHTRTQWDGAAETFFLRMVPLDYNKADLSTQRKTRSTSSSSSSISTSPSPPSSETSFHHNTTPKDSVFNRPSVNRASQYSIRRRTAVAHAKTRLVPRIELAFKNFKEEMDEIEKVKQQIMDEQDQEIATNSTNSSTKRAKVAIDIVSFASSTGDEAANDRKRAYRRVEEVKKAANGSNENSPVELLAVSLAEELRKLNSGMSRSAAHIVLKTIQQTINANHEAFELPYAHAVHQYIISKWSRRQYMLVRRNQLSLAKTNQLLLPPYYRFWNYLVGRLPKHLLDGFFHPPVPLNQDNAHQNRNVVSEIHEAGPYGLTISPEPTDARLPYAPHVFWRLRAVLLSELALHMYEKLVAFYNKLNILEETWRHWRCHYIVISWGGDGAMDEKKNAGQVGHFLAMGMTLEMIVCVPRREKDGPRVVCQHKDHHAFKSCTHCGQLVLDEKKPPFKVTGLGQCDENKAAQRAAFVGSVTADYMDVFNNGVTFKGVHFDVNGLMTKVDMKWSDKEWDFHRSSLWRCFLCNIHLEHEKECSKFCCAYSTSEMILLHQKAATARASGASNSEIYAAGQGHGGSISIELLRMNSFFRIMSGLHCALAIAGRLTFDLFIVTFLDKPVFYELEKKQWTSLMQSEWDKAHNEVKLLLGSEFSCYVSLQEDAKLQRVVLKREEHDDLIRHFVKNKKYEAAVRRILSETCDIFDILRSSHVKQHDRETFKNRVIVWSDFINVTFPTLAWPFYMHLLIAHGQEILEAVKDVGRFNEQSSEACMKKIKYVQRWKSRPTVIDKLVDCILWLWHRDDPAVRSFFVEDGDSSGSSDDSSDDSDQESCDGCKEHKQ